VVITLLVGERVEIVSPDTFNSGGVVVVIADEAVSDGVVVFAATQEALAVCVSKDIFILEDAPGATIDRLGSIGAPSITFSVAGMTYTESDSINKYIAETCEIL